MEFIYQSAKLPKDKQLLSCINEAAKRLHAKVMDLDVSSLEISDYGKRYFGKRKVNSKHLKGILIQESYLLSSTIAPLNIPISETTFIDYGGGNATLSMLAKELGIGIVIYNDIFETSCKDSAVIGKSIDCQADYYVKGDIDDVILFLQKKSLSCNGIASYDVIEHIYDIEVFFSKLHLLSNETLSVFMASGANMLNSKIRKILMEQHIDSEYKSREKPWGYKGNDCFEPYFEVRKRIIQNHSNKLSDNEIEELAKRTRGKNETDIKKSIDSFMKTNKYPECPSHPTNTCNPYNGYWAEHLIDPYVLKNILTKSGFENVDVSGGYRHNVSNNILIKTYRNILQNRFISTFKNYGIRIAPYYVVSGVKKKKLRW